MSLVCVFVCVCVCVCVCTCVYVMVGPVSMCVNVLLREEIYHPKC